MFTTKLKAVPAKAVAGIVLLAVCGVVDAHPVRGEIEAVVDHSGKVESAKLVQSSGDKALDAKALKQYQAQTFPVPNSYSPDQSRFKLLLPVRPVKSAD